MDLKMALCDLAWENMAYVHQISSLFNLKFHKFVSKYKTLMKHLSLVQQPISYAMKLTELV